MEAAAAWWNEEHLMSNDFKEKISRFWHGEIQWDCAMAKYTTMRVGGPAKALVFPKSKEELSTLIKGLQANKLRWRVVGKGSNLLVPDAGYDGVVIVLGADFAAIKIIDEDDGKVVVSAEAGCSLPRFVSWCVERGYTGLEFAGSIPGTIGGAIAMNAGAWGKEMADVVNEVTLLGPTGDIKVREHEDLKFGYRTLRLKPRLIIISATFNLQKAKKTEVMAQWHHYRKVRLEKQPQGVASAGSFFKNPQGQAAGKLIDEAGLKGLRMGGAQISDKHANFIINTGNATATDVLKLMRHVQKVVFDLYNIRLEPEVHILED